MKDKFFLLLMVSSLLLSPLYAQIPAFPGAEGFGSTTPGGRGGAVLFVTNLNADGPGSLKAAIETPGPRIVVFKTGGTIELTADIGINQPFITIAGQTAPGDGISIKGAALGIRTHDVIIRGLRIRVGDAPNGPDPANRDGFSVSSSVAIYNLIIDHCSVSWAIDENIQLYREGHDICIQWSIISEGLRNSLHPEGEHSNGILVGRAGATTNVSIHHNLMAHNLRRNPMIAEGNTAEVINNVVYNWEIGTTVTGEVNIIGNVYKAGNNTGSAKGIILPNWAPAKGTIYVKDNIGPGRLTNSGDDWLAVDGPESQRSFTTTFPLSNLKIDSVENVLDLVLDGAGATFPYLDAVDSRIIADVRNGTGSLIDSQSEVNGWPNIDAGVSWTDTDNDGMDDNWEIFTFGNLTKSENGDEDGDGYTNIEEFINSKFSVNNLSFPSPPQNIKIK